MTKVLRVVSSSMMVTVSSVFTSMATAGSHPLQRTAQNGIGVPAACPIGRSPTGFHEYSRVIRPAICLRLRW